MSTCLKKLVATLCCMMGLLAPPGALADSVLGIEALQFDTPEDAIAHVVSAIAAQDLYGALSASTVLSAKDGCDYVTYVGELGTVPPIQQGILPTTHAVYRDMNEVRMAETFADSMLRVYLSLMPQEHTSLQPLSGLGEEGLAGWIAKVDPDMFAGLAFVRADALDYEKEFGAERAEKLKANLQTRATSKGADEGDERIAVLELDGTNYTMGVTLLRYGESWYVDTLLFSSRGVEDGLTKVVFRPTRRR